MYIFNKMLFPITHTRKSCNFIVESYIMRYNATDGNSHRLRKQFGLPLDVSVSIMQSNQGFCFFTRYHHFIWHTLMTMPANLLYPRNICCLYTKSSRISSQMPFMKEELQICITYRQEYPREQPTINANFCLEGRGEC